MGASRRLLHKLKEQQRAHEEVDGNYRSKANGLQAETTEDIALKEEMEREQHSESGYTGLRTGCATQEEANDTETLSAVHLQQTHLPSQAVTPDAAKDATSGRRSKEQSQSSYKKNKRNKQRKKAQQAVRSETYHADARDDASTNEKAEGEAPKSVSDQHADDEVDKALAELGELGLKDHSPREDVLNVEGNRDASPLAISLKRLKAETELKRLFGSDALRHGSGASDGRSRRQHSSNSRANKSVLCSPKESWPPYKSAYTNCIAMEVVSSVPGGTSFRFVPSSGYEQAANEFESVQMAHDPNALMLLLQKRPYHIDALMAASELLFVSGEPQRAADLLERALYAFERSMHPLFLKQAQNASAFMDAEETLNKCFMDALMRHASCLVRRGCPRTSMECLKLLLSLDRSDPFGSLLMLDHVAIRSKETAWLLELLDDASNEVELPPDALQLPNVVFNLPLARYLEGRADYTSTRDAIACSILMYPDALAVSLWEHWESSHEVQPQWAALWNKKLFESRRQTPFNSSATLQHACKLFALRNQRMWLDEPQQTLLLDAAQQACEMHDQGHEYASKALERAKEAFPYDGGHNELSHVDARLFTDEISQELPGGVGLQQQEEDEDAAANVAQQARGGEEALLNELHRLAQRQAGGDAQGEERALLDELQYQPEDRNLLQPEEQPNEPVEERQRVLRAFIRMLHNEDDHEEEQQLADDAASTPENEDEEGRDEQTEEPDSSEHDRTHAEQADEEHQNGNSRTHDVLHNVRSWLTGAASLRSWLRSVLSVERPNQRASEVNESEHEQFAAGNNSDSSGAEQNNASQ